MRLAYTKEGLIAYAKFLYERGDHLQHVNDADILQWFLDNRQTRDILIPVGDRKSIAQVTSANTHSVFTSIDRALNLIIDALDCDEGVKNVLRMQKSTFKRIQMIADTIKAINNRKNGNSHHTNY